MSRLSVLRRPAFRRYYLCAVAGVNGMWAFRVLMSWTAWDMTGAAGYVGLVAALSLAPVAVTGPFFGALIDRRPILRSFGIVSAALALCPALFVLLAAGGMGFIYRREWKGSEWCAR